MTLQGIFPAWLGEVGTGEPAGPGGTTIIDSFTAVLEADLELQLVDDSLEVVADAPTGIEIEDDEISIVLDDDITGDMECS